VLTLHFNHPVFEKRLPDVLIANTYFVSSNSHRKEQPICFDAYVKL